MDNYNNNTNYPPQPNYKPNPTTQPGFNQNNSYRPNPEFNQNNGYRPNPEFNQNNGYRPNPEFNQNNGYMPNPEFNQNNGYRPNPEFNQNNNFYNPNTYSNYNNSYNNNHNYNPHYNQNDYEQNSKTTTTKKKTSDSWLFIIVGLIFLVIGILLTLQQINDRTNYNYMVEHGQSTYAEITDVQRKTTRSSSGTGRTRTSSTKTYYYIDGIYEVDNQQYTMEFKTQSSSHYVGESIKIYYEVGNPSNYVREGDDGGSIIFGIIFASLGLIAALAGIKDYSDKRKLNAMDSL